MGKTLPLVPKSCITGDGFVCIALSPLASQAELVAVVSKKVTAEQVNAAMKAAANESFGYTEEELVSSDIIGIDEGSLFDATQTKVTELGDKSLVKVVAWYDNEMSYTNQMVRVVKLVGSL